VFWSKVLVGGGLGPCAVKGASLIGCSISLTLATTVWCARAAAVEPRAPLAAPSRRARPRHPAPGSGLPTADAPAPRRDRTGRSSRPRGRRALAGSC
jgi:hypothetical protein